MEFFIFSFDLGLHCLNVSQKRMLCVYGLSRHIFGFKTWNLDGMCLNYYISNAIRIFILINFNETRILA